MGQHLDEKRFHTINRAVKLALKENKYNAKKLGKTFNVSHGTITRIRNAKTWPGFLALKASRQTSPKQSEVEKELQTDLEVLETAPTRSEFVNELKIVHDRQDAARSNQKAVGAEAARATWISCIALAISIIAFIISIAALVN